MWLRLQKLLLQKTTIHPSIQTGALVRFRHDDRTKRNLVQVYTNEEYDKILKDKNTKSKRTRKRQQKSSENFDTKNESFDTGIEVGETNELTDEVYSELRKLKYTSPNVAKINQFSNIMMNLKSKSYRNRHFSCLLEGKFLIQDAMEAGLFIRTIYFTRLSNLVGLPMDILKKCNLVKVGFDEIQIASEVKHQSTGLIAVASKPQEKALKKMALNRSLRNKNAIPMTVICNGVKDAGNLGTIIRSASSAGCQQVIATKGCCDVWDAKCIRSGAGAHFKLPIQNNLDWDEIYGLLTDLDVRQIFICHPENSEIHLQQILNNKQEDESNKLHQKLESEFQVEKLLEPDIANVVLKSRLHFDVEYFNKGHTVVIIGGEVGGVDDDAYITAAKLKVVTSKFSNLSLVTIPMFEQNDCLNSCVAGSIIIYEAKKQFLQVQQQKHKYEVNEDDEDEIVFEKEYPEDDSAIAKD